MHTALMVFVVWTLVGYFACGLFPKIKTRKEAILQLAILGPFFWVGTAIYAAFIGLKKLFCKV